MAIDRKELQELFNTDEGKELFKELAKTAGFKSQDEIKGLSNKKDELLDELKNFRKVIGESGVDKSGFEAYFRDKEAEAQRAGELEDRLKNLRDEVTGTLTKKHEGELSSLQEQLAKAHSTIDGSLLQTAIDTNISPKGVTSGTAKHKALSALLRESASVKVSEDGKRGVVFRVDGEEKNSEEFFTSFWEGDGKEFISSGNGGSGAEGSNGSGAKSYKEMTLTERGQLFRENRAEHDRLKNA